MLFDVPVSRRLTARDERRRGKDCAIKGCGASTSEPYQGEDEGHTTARGVVGLTSLSRCRFESDAGL